MKVCMFPGQGAQRLGMGQDIFVRYKEQIDQADELLGYSMVALCQEGPIERLNKTEFTQPALYVVNSLGYLHWLDENEDPPDYVLGHSVSEYVALFAAGVLDFVSGLKLVAKRGALMSEARGGGMAAVLGLDAVAIEDLLQAWGLGELHCANFNTPKQIVVSGSQQAITEAENRFLEAGATHYRVLPVSGAFHTVFMEEARRDFANYIANVEFHPQQIPVISNVTALPHRDTEIPSRMVEQITSPVRWSDSLRYLLAKGVTFADTLEIGPGGPPILRPMFKRTELEAGPMEAEVPAQEEALSIISAPEMLSELHSEASAFAEAPSVVSKTVMDRPDAPAATRGPVSMESIGSRAFCEAFGLRYPYVSGSMYRGIASVELVVRMARAGLLGFFGAAGLPVTEIRSAIQAIRAQIPLDASFGVNFIAHLNRPQLEDALTDVLLQESVDVIEASAFMDITQALVRYRAKGLQRDGSKIRAGHRIIAKVSRPDVAAQFLSSAPERIIERLLHDGAIDGEQAELLRLVPMADAICVESDSGGHTDQGMPFALIPPILILRDAAQTRFPDFGPLFVGAAGGIGTPEAAAALIILGADFITTGSINQCTREAGTSDAVKDMLEGIDVFDTAYAPSGEMFELGSKIQVLKKGVFFPARAEKLVAIYRRYDGLEALDSKLRRQIEDGYFGRSLEEVFADVARSFPAAEIERAQRMPKHRMALVFKRYFRDTTEWALQGELSHKVDFQIHCGPAQGAFNQWVSGTTLASWHQRHVDEIGLRLLDEAAMVLNRRLSVLLA